jgi:hypothetical protein
VQTNRGKKKIKRKEKIPGWIQYHDSMNEKPK